MSDKKLTDAEIVKALECLSGKGLKCMECPYSPRFQFPLCQQAVAKDVFSLITCLQAENEQLKKKPILTHRITFNQEKLEEIKNDCLKCIDYNIRQIESEARREFAEKAKMKCSEIYDDVLPRLFAEIIDSLLKEMESESDAE